MFGEKPSLTTPRVVMRRVKSPLERRRRAPRVRSPGTAKRPAASAALAHYARSVVADERGAVAFEFLLVSPFLLFILFAIVEFGIALNNQLILTAAAEQGAETLAFGRGTTTPYTTAVAAIDNSVVNLNTSQLTQTVTVGGSTCSSDSGCSALLTAGAAASIGLSYPCQLTIMGVAFGTSPCTLYASSAATVQ
jgi:Flp pilus assembly protein TadG